MLLKMLENDDLIVVAAVFSARLVRRTCVRERQCFSGIEGAIKEFISLRHCIIDAGWQIVLSRLTVEASAYQYAVERA